METVSHDIRLAARALHAIADVAGLQLRCDEGTLWLTLDHDIRDVILEAGDTYRGTEHRRAIVCALKAARMSVSAMASEAALPRPSARPAFWPAQVRN